MKTHGFGRATSSAGALEGGRHAQAHTLADMNNLIAQILAELATAGFAERDLFGVRLSLEEALVNSIKHGHGEDPTKTVRVDYQITPGRFAIRIEDEGPGFNPDRVPDPLAPENLERPGGRGVFLMRHYMTDVHYNDRGNVVTLTKNLK